MISIILPTYNCADYLDRSIMSVIRQTYNNWELLIIDDGSTDNTKEICNYYCNIDKRIKYIYQINQGVSVARNNGINLAQGQYIAFLDADDLYTSNFCSELIYKIYNYDIAYSGFTYKKEDNTNKSKILKETGNILIPYLNSISNQEHPLCICSMLIKKDILIKNQILFTPHVKNCEDTEFIIKVLYVANANYFNGHLFTYLQGRAGSATSNTPIINQITSILESFKRIYISSPDNIKPHIRYLIKKEINFWLKTLLSRKLRKNIKTILSIKKWEIYNRNILNIKDKK